MEHRAREIRTRHLQRIIQRPERRPEAIAETCESAARCGIRFDHEQRFPNHLRHSRRCAVRPHQFHRRAVVQEARKNRLGVDRRPDARLAEAVVRRVAGYRQIYVNRKGREERRVVTGRRRVPRGCL